MNYPFRSLCLGCVLLGVPFWAGAASPAPAVQNEAQTYSFGIVPQQSASELAKLWVPILTYLENKTGYRLQFTTARDIPTFEQRLAASEYDFAYMNPYHYTVFHASLGYTAVVAERDRQLEGIVVVRKDSSYQSIADLGGMRIAFPSPASFAASILPSRFMDKNGIAHTPVYVSSHDSVYLTVAQGLYPAGAGIERTLALVDPAVRAQLRVLWVTQSVAPHPIAVHPRVPSQVTERLKSELLAMAADPQGSALLKALGFNDFVEVDDADYDTVRALDIHLLDSYK